MSPSNDVLSDELRDKVPQSLWQSLSDSDQGELLKNRCLKNRTMLVCFCDLIGSTRALRTLGAQGFQEVQSRILDEFEGIVKDLTPSKQHGEKRPEPAERGALVLDKFMGDGAMFYIDCGSHPSVKAVLPKEERSDFDTQKQQFENRAKSKQRAAPLMMNLISQIVKELTKVNDELARAANPITLGARFGVAAGDKVTLSFLGRKLALSFTVTGETVNLAARLEHATEAEFLQAIAIERNHLAAFTSQLGEDSAQHGSVLGNEHLNLDRRVFNLYDITKKRFQVRANDEFVMALNSASEENIHQDKQEAWPSQASAKRLGWKMVPFSPRGFGSRNGARLIGGNTLGELFRIV